MAPQTRQLQACWTTASKRSGARPSSFRRMGMAAMGQNAPVKASGHAQRNEPATPAAPTPTPAAATTWPPSVQP